MERTFLMVKPDGVQRGLLGELITRFEKKGFKLTAAKFTQVTEQQAETHYIEHKDKPFFPSLIEYITSGPVLAMVWEGAEIVKLSRIMIGKTNPAEAAPGTIRADYGMELSRNVIHGSDSPESADREIKNFFDVSELTEYRLDKETWIYE